MIYHMLYPNAENEKRNDKHKSMGLSTPGTIDPKIWGEVEYVLKFLFPASQRKDIRFHLFRKLGTSMVAKLFVVIVETAAGHREFFRDLSVKSTKVVE